VKLFGATFGKELPRVQNQTYYTLTSEDTAFLEALGIDVSTVDKSKIGEITFFICLKFLAENLSKLPIKQYTYTPAKGKEQLYDRDLDRILNLEPNPYMSATDFWAAVENNRNYFGNAYVYADDERGRLKNLWIIPSEEMEIYIDDAGIFKKKDALYYVWKASNGERYIFNQREIAHYKTSVTFNGIIGLAVKDILKMYIENGQYSQEYLQKLYKGNMFGGKIILQYTGDLGKSAKSALVKEIESYSSSTETGRFLPLPLGITATPIEMKLSDAEFAELNKLNALQIAAAFGIKPNILNNYEKSSYANSETQQLDFYINTLSHALKHYKEVNSRKLVANTTLEHDTKVLFKLDPVKQMTVLSKGINNFMYTINDCREELGLPYIDHPMANIPIGNGNYKTIDEIVADTEENKGGE